MLTDIDGFIFVINLNYREPGVQRSVGSNVDEEKMRSYN